MNDTAIIPQQFDNLSNRISHLESVLYKIAEKVGVSPEALEPLYGSDIWWKWSDEKALNDIKNGRYVGFKTPEELQRHLDSLK
jgi:hypothetical protein